MRTNVFRRMHRKIVVIDARIAFIGGLNYSAEHMSSYGPEAKQDYAVRLEGPIVEDILQFELETCPTERGTTLVATSSQSGREPPAGRSAGIAGLAR